MNRQTFVYRIKCRIINVIYFKVIVRNCYDFLRRLSVCQYVLIVYYTRKMFEVVATNLRTYLLMIFIKSIYHIACKIKTLFLISRLSD